MRPRACLAFVLLSVRCVACAPRARREEAVPPPTASAERPLASAPASVEPPRDAPPPLPHAPSDMALVPGGPFTMGADVGGELDEHPAHEVEVAAFYLDLTEVTNEAWARCVDASACTTHDATSAARNGFGSDAAFRGPRQPVSAVSWDAARGYCAWMHKRLPTEAEWEKAARGTDARQYPWGNEEPTREHAVFSGVGRTADVGTHPLGRGPYGHHDLAGNVWEWVEDVYDPYAYTRPDARAGKGSTCDLAMAAQDDLRAKGKKGFTGSNPIPTECERVLRGGAFNYAAPGIRATNRVHHAPRYRLVMAGFRCAKSTD